MKSTIAFMFSLLLACFSCNTNSQNKSTENKNRLESSDSIQIDPVNKTKLKKTDSVLINSMYEKVVAKLNALNVPLNELNEAIIKVLAESSFQNEMIEPVQLTSKKCPFDPYMLVVYDDKLDLLNTKLDSIYTLDFKEKIQTALWSPFKRSEIYILTTELKRKPGAKYAYAINRKLFCLNLNSMELSYLTTFIDYSKTIYNIYGEDYEPPTFFLEMSSLEIDKSKEMICAPCYYQADTLEGGCCLPNLLSYKYEIKTGTTQLSKKTEIENTHNTGKKLESAKTFHSALDGSNFVVKNDSVKIIMSEEGLSEVKIPVSVFDENNYQVTDYFWHFRTYFLECGMVFSVSQEEAMAKYKGHVYLMDYNGKLLKQLGKDMGEFFQISELEHHNYLIDPFDSNFNTGQPGLYLYDSAFNLLKQYRNVFHYEIIP